MNTFEIFISNSIRIALLNEYKYNSQAVCHLVSMYIGIQLLIGDRDPIIKRGIGIQLLRGG